MTACQPSPLHLCCQLLSVSKHPCQAQLHFRKLGCTCVRSLQWHVTAREETCSRLFYPGCTSNVKKRDCWKMLEMLCNLRCFVTCPYIERLAPHRWVCRLWVKTSSRPPAREILKHSSYHFDPKAHDARSIHPAITRKYIRHRTFSELWPCQQPPCVAQPLSASGRHCPSPPAVAWSCARKRASQSLRSRVSISRTKASRTASRERHAVRSDQYPGRWVHRAP